MRIRLLIFLLSLLLVNFVFSQSQIFPLNNDIQFSMDRLLLSKNGNPINTSFRPFAKDDFDIISDSVFNYYHRDNHMNVERRGKWFWRKLRRESFIQIDSANYKLAFDPYFDLTLLKNIDGTDSKNYINSRGVIVNGSVGKKFSFVTSFIENQAIFPEYIQDYTLKNKVVPGQGYSRKYKENGSDYGYASGYFDYNASSYLSVRFGHGKNFIGDGYRSLLLSDAAFSYPYLMLSSKLWKFQYINLYSAYLDLNTPKSSQGEYRKKYSTSHYLIYRPIKSVSIGLFESVVWQAGDSLSNRGFELNYLNPIIFYHPVQFNLGSPDNSVLGLNLDWKFVDKNMIYAQFVMDDFNVSKLKENGFFQEKYGFQLGVRGVDLFGIKDLAYLLEYNQVQPYVYAHKDPRQNYSHFNEALAHPLGANFQETVSMINYKKGDFYINAKINYAFYGADSSNSHWGKDIYKSDYVAQRENHEFSVGNELAQGVRTSLWTKTLSIGYVINPKTNMVIELGLNQRSEKSILKNDQTTFFYFSFRTKLFNQYYDF